MQCERGGTTDIEVIFSCEHLLDKHQILVIKDYNYVNSGCLKTVVEVVSKKLLQKNLVLLKSYFIEGEYCFRRLKEP